jgi:purine-binding chemotaxis protein CheW
VPPFICGIVNLHGKIRTVIDLKRFFDLPPKGITEANMILLLEHAGVQLCILADAVCGVRTLASADLQAGLPTLTGRRADYLRGVTVNRLIVLDAARLLADKRIIVDEQVEG